MNNFKKLLASAMALTMVTSVLPAATTNVSAADSTTCDVTSLAPYTTLNSFLNRNDLDVTTMNSDHMINRNTNVFDYVLGAEVPVEVEVETEETVTFEYQEDNYVHMDGSEEQLTYADVVARVQAWLEQGTVEINDTVIETIDGEGIREYIPAVPGSAISVTLTTTTTATQPRNLFLAISEGYAAGCGITLTERSNAGKAYEVASAMNEAFGTDYTGYETGRVYKVVKALEEDAENSQLRTHQNYLEDLVDDYSTNMTEAQVELIDGLLDEIYDRLGINPGDDEYEETLSEFVKDLLEDGINLNPNEDNVIDKNDILSLEDFLTSYETITKSMVNAQINKIESLDLYRSFEDESDVMAVIEEYEAMLDSIDEVVDALNTRLNESYNDYITGGSRSVRSAVRSLLTDPKVVDDDYVNNLIYNITVDQYNVLKAFKEDVVDVVWTMEAREFANRYVDSSSKNVFATQAQLNSVLRDFMNTQDTDAALLAFDSTNGTWAWDDLTAHMEEVIASLDLIENELSKLEAVTITANDRDLLNSIDDAVFYLKEYSEGNLTSAQTRELRNAERKVDELLEAYRSKFGTVGTTTGWVDMGNGNWNYYEADGTAPTKWICTAPNTWYYVQNGNMMRNYWVWRDANSAYYVGDDGVMVYGPTTVNGYELDANGLWHR